MIDKMIDVYKIIVELKKNPLNFIHRDYDDETSTVSLYRIGDDVFLYNQGKNWANKKATKISEKDAIIFIWKNRKEINLMEVK